MVVWWAEVARKPTVWPLSWRVTGTDGCWTAIVATVAVSASTVPSVGAARADDGSARSAAGEGERAAPWVIWTGSVTATSRRWVEADAWL